MANYGATADETTSKYDFDGDGTINVKDLGFILNHYNPGYAIFNEGELTIEDMSENKFSGEPEAIYNEGGTVIGYDLD